jgi:hypothetical protein
VACEDAKVGDIDLAVEVGVAGKTIGGERGHARIGERGIIGISL